MSTLAGLIRAIITLGPLVAAMIRWYRGLSQDSQAQFLADARKVFSDLDNPTTSEEKKSVAKNLQTLIRRM